MKWVRPNLKNQKTHPIPKKKKKIFNEICKGERLLWYLVWLPFDIEKSFLPSSSVKKVGNFF